MSKKRASRSSQPTTSRKLSSTKDRLLHKRNDRPSSKDYRPSPAQRRSSTSISESLSTLNSQSTVPGALTQLLGGRRSTLKFPSARRRRQEETESGEVGQAAVSKQAAIRLSLADDTVYLESYTGTNRYLSEEKFSHFQTPELPRDNAGSFGDSSGHRLTARARAPFHYEHADS